MKRRMTLEGKPFKFNPETLREAEEILSHYPDGRKASALVPLLDLAQRQLGGWISQEAIEYVASYIGISNMQAYEVATFYSMFNLHPVGKHLVQVCTTTPCQLRGGDEILKVCHRVSGVPQGETSKDGFFTVVEVECLGACVNAPVVQINDDYYENLTPESTEELLERLRAGEQVTPGPQNGGCHSELCEDSGDQGSLSPDSKASERKVIHAG